MFRWLGVLIGFVFALTLALPAQARSGATFIVTRLDDPAPGSCLLEDCSLREAIMAANTDANADSISFALDGTVELSIAPSGTNDATSGDLNVTNPVIIQGRGSMATVVDGNQLDRVFNIEVTAEPTNASGGCETVLLEDLTVTGGQVTGNGGGVAALFCTALNNVILQNNDASNYGGGVYGQSYRITNSAVVSNSAAYGGGVAVQSYGIIVNNVTISGNSASANGGGLVSIGEPQLFLGPYVDIDNSTVVFNSSNAGANGAGIGSHLMSNGTEHSITPGNNIVAYNTGGVQCGPLDAGSPSSPNLTTDGSCETTLVGNPQIGALADNGGDTLTHALGMNSPALDAGTCAAGTDQRGEPRPVDLPGYPNTDNGCDLGAYEAQAVPPTAVGLGTWTVTPATSPLYAPTLALLGLVGGVLLMRYRRRAQ